MYKFILVLLFSTTCFATLNDVDKAFVEHKNILTNPGFENGLSSWTASGGTFAVATSGTNLLTGKASVTWDSSSASQTLTSTAVAIPNGLKGKSGYAKCSILTPSGTATHTIQAYDGSSILASSTITSNTSPVNSGVSFIFPSSGNIQLRLVSVASDEPSITLDDCYLGEATNILQTQEFSSMTSAGTITIGAITTPPTKGTIVVDKHLYRKEGQFLYVYYEYEHNGGTPAVGSGNYLFSLPTGYTINTNLVTLTTVTTTFAWRNCLGFFLYNAGGGNQAELCAVPYSTTQFRLIGLIGGSNNILGSVAGGFNSTNVHLGGWIKVPVNELSSSVTAIKPDMTAGSWSGYHDNTCSWAVTNTSYAAFAADATCVFTERTNQNFGTVTSALSGSDKLPGITFTPKRAGRYFICANTAVRGTSNVPEALQLTDGTTVVAEWGQRGQSNSTSEANAVSLCGIYVASDTSAKTVYFLGKSSSGSLTMDRGLANTSLGWTIFQIDQAFPMPAIANGVISSSSGRVKIASARINNSGTPAVAQQDGAWISSLTDNGTGDTTINVAASVFSAAPNCTCTTYNTADPVTCTIDSTTSISSTAVRVQTYTAGGSVGDVAFSIICVGAP